LTPARWRSTFVHDRDLTFARYKQEMWYPALMSRLAHKTWTASDKKPLRERLRDRVTDMVQTHRPPLIPDDKRREIERLLK